MSVSPNALPEALAYARNEVRNGSARWHALCQMFVHDMWGIPALFGSAWAQWLGADSSDKHVGGSPDDAPVGAALCFKGSGVFGHIDTAAHPFRSGNSAAFSNDLIRDGHIDKVHRSAPTTVWGQRYLGYLTAVNNYDLQLHLATPVPKPKQVRYRAVGEAVTKMGLALDTAKAQGDKADVALLEKEITDLKALYAKIRRNA